MQYEVDYMAVGDGEKGGDAICMRFGNLSGPRNEWSVVVIDGGFTDSGENLVNHITKLYGTNDVNLVIATHPDADHILGLHVVLEKLNVAQLAMHLPWNHASDIKELFKNSDISTTRLETKIEKALKNASDLEDFAISKGIEVIEPFQGMEGFGGILKILGPSKEYYEGLIPQFRETPKAKESVFETIGKSFSDAINWIEDQFDIDLLDDDTDTTSAENNSSVISFFQIGERKILFTGDSGKTALHNALDFAEANNLDLTNLSLFDVPHHGSKRNISSKILNRISASMAFVSAPKESIKHPSKKVTNGLKKKGMNVGITRGQNICHYEGGLNRSGWGPLQLEEFHEKVED
ncbi:MBL fold metallo-hydrolase [Candidatus Gracilibacteria bacterium]|nr:MBL fold metallo-hydrolase [Candidatus Gracilibacteria bacterium]